MRLHTLLALSLSTFALAACTLDPSLLSILPLRPVGGGTPGPTPSGDCTMVQPIPAPIFHVGFVSPASAGATVSLEPWVFLEAPVMVHDAVLPETFAATVDEQAREIVVAGQVKATRPNPAADCGFPAIYTFPKAATMSLPVVLQASGTYTVRIAAESFTTRRPEEMQHPNDPPKTYPQPAETRTLVIN